MSPAQLDEKDVFNACRHIGDPGRRESYLESACGEDAEARGRIRRLLRAHAESPGFLEAPAVAAFDPGALERPLESAGSVIGPYRLLEPIGEGGFGVVFLAEQVAPVRRRVALKVIKPGMDTREVIARFEAERQALALMDHPNIARVLDAGATDAGRPFFVMELVRGVPITEYCDAHHLAPRQRLELFVAACQAVQHAHQKGIIHRDIKPSNVLVTRQDDRPVVKVIDFGVAKATSGQLTDKTVFTGFAQLIGTPLYMSPEQASLNALDVDTRSDVYSLGVLLYELLTGATPFDTSRLKEADFDEFRRILREEPPERPSTRLSTAGGLKDLAANRGTEPGRLTRLVRGELDWIVMKALEKDRTRRYETANGLALDVQRYLAGAPVSACPPSVGYRLRTFARRNKAALATAGLAGVALLVVAGSLGWTMRDRAARRGRNAEAVAALLDQGDVALRAGRADRASVALEAAERRAADGGAEGLRDRLAGRRADLALLRELDAIDTFSWTWTEDRKPADAALAARWRHALAAYGITPDQGPVEVAAERVNASLVKDRVLTALDLWLVVATIGGADLAAASGLRTVLDRVDPDPYRTSVREALAARDGPALAALAARPDATAQPSRFAVVLGLPSAVPVERRREVMETGLRERPGDLILLMALGNSYSVSDREETSERDGASERVRWFQAAVAAHPTNVAARNNLGVALSDRGDAAGALACYREAVRLDPSFARGHANIGAVLRRLGRLDEAAESLQTAIHRKRDDAVPYDQLGALLLDDRQDPAAAIPYLREAVRIDPTSADRHANLGRALRKSDPEGAIDAFRRATERDPDHAESHCNLGGVLLDLGRYPEALPWLRRGHELGHRRPGWRYPSGQWVAMAERFVALEARLSAVLAGEAARPEDLLELASLCLYGKKRYADAVLLFGRAFAEAPDPAQPWKGRPRYDAACAAVLAATGRGGVAAAADPGERTRLRGLALGWLRAELAADERSLEEQPALAARIHAGLQHWLDDPDLSGVRDAAALAELPDPERPPWRGLWSDVSDLRSRAAKR